MYVGKLLYDESFRYFHYVMVPDVIYQFDRVTDNLKDYRDSYIDYYHLPTELSYEALTKLFIRLYELRLEHKLQRKREKKEKRIGYLEETLDSDIYLLTMEGQERALGRPPRDFRSFLQKAHLSGAFA